MGQSIVSHDSTVPSCTACKVWADLFLATVQAVVHVMSNYKEIETCLECSAKNLVFVAEVTINWLVSPCQCASLQD
jgi:hypothetical protein